MMNDDDVLTSFFTRTDLHRVSRITETQFFHCNFGLWSLSKPIQSSDYDTGIHSRHIHIRGDMYKVRHDDESILIQCSQLLLLR